MRFAFALLMATVLKLSVVNVYPDYALLGLEGSSGTCLVEVSESSKFKPLLASAQEPAPMVWPDGTRLFTLGKRDERVLRPGQTYYVRVSKCGGSVTTSFTTPKE